MLAVAATAFLIMPKRPKHMFPVIGVVLLAVWLTGPELAERFGSTFASAEERDASAESRVDLWRDCLVVIGQYPILGVGPANWVTIVAQFGWPAGKSAHSVWMEMAAETGAPGAMLLLSFFGLAAWRLWPLARTRAPAVDPYEQALAAGTVLAVVGFVVSGQFVSAPTLEMPYYIVTAGIGMLKVRALRAKAAVKAPAVPHRLAVVSPPAGARSAGTVSVRFAGRPLGDRPVQPVRTARADLKGPPLRS